MYRTQIASDVQRNGLGVEVVSPDGTILAEVFRRDDDHTVSFALFDGRIPLRALELLVTRAKVDLHPFEDGTPLSAAW